MTNNQADAVFNSLRLLMLLKRDTDCTVEDTGFGMLYAAVIVALAMDRATLNDFTNCAIPREQRERIMQRLILALPHVIEEVSIAEEEGVALEAARNGALS